MGVHRLAIIARKETLDHITSKKFLLLLLMLSIVVGIGAINGINDYQGNLERYKSGDSSNIPSPLSIISPVTEAIGYYGFGAIIAIALGFDLVAGEKETRSLRSLLSHPLYRDEIINGKAIGGILALTIAITAVFTLVFAMLLIQGIVPSLYEFSLMLIIWLITIVFLASNFALALMASVIAGTSSNALILTLIILFVLSFFIPVFGAKFTVNTMLGDNPRDEITIVRYYANSEENEEYLERLEDKQRDYNQKESAINDFLSLFSIQSNYSALTGVFAKPPWDCIDGTPILSFNEVINKVWSELLFFLLYPSLFFGIAYVKFMRMDLR